ncbi:hypothetical protein Tco_0256954 [Tanacetum coccineum]
MQKFLFRLVRKTKLLVSCACISTQDEANFVGYSMHELQGPKERKFAVQGLQLVQQNRNAQGNIPCLQ